MSVNNMDFKQAAILLNNLRQQVTGQTALAPANTAEFVSVGQTVLQQGYDPVLNAITQMIGRTIFSIRPYRRKFAGIEVDSMKWGSITRKLAISDKDFEQSVRFELVDGQAVDMFKINKPVVLQLNFYGQNVFDKGYTIFKDQLDNAFTGPDEFGRFMTMVTQNVADMIEQNFETICRAIIANFIGGKVAANNGVIHLLTEYNTETGLNLTATTLYAPENFADFIKWMYARVATLTSLMTERSGKFQIQVTGKPIMRHTPLSMQKVYLYAPLLNQMNARVLADAYHDDFLEYSDVEAVNFWQSIDDPMKINVAATYLQADGTLATQEEASAVDKIAGVIFDEEALGYTTVHDWSATSPFNIKAGYWNTNHAWTNKWWNDFTEKGIILLLD